MVLMVVMKMNSNGVLRKGRMVGQVYDDGSIRGTEMETNVLYSRTLQNGKENSRQDDRVGGTGKQ